MGERDLLVKLDSMGVGGLFEVGDVLIQRVGDHRLDQFSYAPGRMVKWFRCSFPGTAQNVDIEGALAYAKFQANGAR